MKKYWFKGIMPQDTIGEDDLTEEQKEIIKIQNSKLTKENLELGWLGFYKEDNWEFMRIGIESIFIKEKPSRGNIARLKLIDILKTKYKL